MRSLHTIQPWPVNLDGGSSYVNVITIGPWDHTMMQAPITYWIITRENEQVSGPWQANVQYGDGWRAADVAEISRYIQNQDGYRLWATNQYLMRGRLA